MKRWDIIFVRADERDLTGHPGIVLSDDAILADPHQRRINVLMGTKKTPAVAPRTHHVVLDEADGLDHLTLFDCALIYLAPKSAVIRTAGTVTEHRQTDIRRKVRACLGLG